MGGNPSGSQHGFGAPVGLLLRDYGPAYRYINGLGGYSTRPAGTDFIHTVLIKEVALET